MHYSHNMEGLTPHKETPSEKAMRLARNILAGTATQTERDEAKNTPEEIGDGNSGVPATTEQKNIPKWMLEEARKRSLGDPKE